MDQNVISGMIYDAAQNYALERGFRFGAGADGDFQRFASTTATEIASLPTIQQQARINAAVLSFERLIDEMITQSRRIVGYQEQNAGVIGEQTLSAALNVLCPLWPFC